MAEKTFKRLPYGNSNFERLMSENCVDRFYNPSMILYFFNQIINEHLKRAVILFAGKKKYELFEN